MKASAVLRHAPVLLAAVLLIAAALRVDGLYLLRQGAYAAHHTFSAEPIDELRERAAIDADTAAFFDRVDRIREFATATLGLADTDNYTTYIEMERDHLVDVVSAVRELSFERHRWWYPVLGPLPYRGYYNRDGAIAEARRLEGAGYDVLLREVDAYSSLGVVPDPLYSFMREYSEYRLAELIIHELAHATVFVPGQAAFNEEFAGFVGREGALAYLREQHGAASAEYLRTVRRLRDRRVFLGFVAALRGRLQEVYAEELSASEMRARKRQVIAEMQQTFATFSDRWFLSDAYDWFGDAELDNALIDLYATYNESAMRSYGDEESSFDVAYRRLGRSIPALVRAVERAATAEDPRAALSESLDSAPPSGDG